MPFWAIESKKWMGSGWMDGMVIIGQWSSKSTVGAIKNSQCERHSSSHVDFVTFSFKHQNVLTPDSPALSLSALLVRIGIAIMTIPEPAHPYFIRYCSSWGRSPLQQRLANLLGRLRCGWIFTMMYHNFWLKIWLLAWTTALYAAWGKTSLKLVLIDALDLHLS